MYSLNTSLFYSINTAAGMYPWLDAFFVVLTLYGIESVAVLLMYYLFYTIPQRTRSVGDRLRAYMHGLEITLAAFATWFAVYCIKVLAQIPRPSQVLLHVHTLVIETDYSFPSGHAAVAFAIATGVYFYHPKLGKILFIFGVLIAVSRVYVGVHYPVDVVVGGILGYVIAACIYRLARRTITTVEAPDIPHV